MKNFVSCLILTLFIFHHLTGGDIKGKVTLEGKKSHANAVVYIDKIPGKTFKPPKEPVQMDQRNLEFIPHILPILAGTTVEFLNNDDVLHNVYCPDACAQKFDLGTWPRGQTRKYTFENPGCVAVMLCNIHPAMEAYVLVLETPYFAKSNKDGSYIIKDVPPGKYTLKVWHKTFKGTDVTVEVPKQGEAVVNFELKKSESK